MNEAKTILEQLGGWMFCAMTGARNLTDHGRALSFRLPSNFATSGINYVKVTLTDADLYDVTYGKVRGLKYAVVATSEGLYFDMLRADFSEKTGLDCTMGWVIAGR